MAGMSPTQLTLREMRKRGYRVAVVEHWNHFARIRQDLFGCIDILCIGGGETIAIQATSYSNVSARIRKVAEADAIGDMREAGWTVLVHGWRKIKNKWELREEDVS